MLQDYKDFAEYIAQRYPKAERIVEIGVGKELSVLEELRRRMKAEVVAIDVRGGSALKDDVTRPRLELYRGASLIYSIRPNPELYPHLIKVAREVGADLIIRPLSSDPPPERGKLVNYKRSVFYIFRAESNYI